jgi:hypothetical protein
MMSRQWFAALVAVLLAVAGLAGLLTMAAAQSSSAEGEPDRLALVSEITGYLAVETPLGTDCVFDVVYQLYLCEQPISEALRTPDPAARAQALRMLTTTGALLIPDSTNKRLMVFDSTTGDLIDPNFILMEDEPTGTVIHAILSASGDSLLISDQTRDVVHEYDLEGNNLGIFAPSGGANTDILDNIRGIALRPNGNLLVSVGAGPNANAIAEFDTDGEYLGNFVANGSGGLDSPFDVYQRVGTDWLVSSINNNLVIGYHLDTGAPLGDFASINSFPQQLLEIGNSNVLLGNFSGTQTGVVELTSAGVLVGVYNPGGVSGNRGVYELPNGHILTSTSGGVFVIDRAGNLVDTKYTGQSRFIEYVLLSLPGIEFSKTVGLDPAVCAETDEISVPSGTAVTYCFEVTNTGSESLGLHDLVDSELGLILNGFPFDLLPGATIFVTQTAVIEVETPNLATWTAYNPGPSDVVEATDSATVHILQPGIALAKTVGLDPDLCAETDELWVLAGTAVVYCFEVTNSGEVALGLHDLVDSELGSILEGFAFNLLPGASVFLTQTAVIEVETTNTATWTAYNPGPMHTVSAEAQASVYILSPAISLAVTAGTEQGVCAADDTLTVPAGTLVYFCATVTNTGNVPFDSHLLVDSLVGEVGSFNFDLQPGLSHSFIYPLLIEAEHLAEVTWEATAGEIGASASALVSVYVQENYYLYLPVVIK